MRGERLYDDESAVQPFKQEFARIVNEMNPHEKKKLMLMSRLSLRGLALLLRT